MMNVKVLVLWLRAAVFASVLFLSGCTMPFVGGYGAEGQSREAFKQRVENVFHLQNQMTSEVMMLLESDQSLKTDSLIKAEQHMQQMCADLNEYASRDIDGLSIGLFLQWRVEKSAIACEQAALAIKPLLSN